MRDNDVVTLLCFSFQTPAGLTVMQQKKKKSSVNLKVFNEKGQELGMLWKQIF